MKPLKIGDLIVSDWKDRSGTTHAGLVWRVTRINKASYSVESTSEQGFFCAYCNKVTGKLSR